MLFDAQVLGGSQSGRRITSRLGGYSNRSDRRSMQVRERPQTTADADADADADARVKRGNTELFLGQKRWHPGSKQTITQSLRIFV